MATPDKDKIRLFIIVIEDIILFECRQAWGRLIRRLERSFQSFAKDIRFALYSITRVSI